MPNSSFRRRSPRLLPLLFALPFALAAQQPPAADPTALESSVVERGPHHRVVQWLSRETDAAGNTTVFTNQYIEVATGMHYVDERGRLQETVAEFVPVKDGFVAARGPHQVSLAGDLSAAGAVTVVTPDGKTLRNCSPTWTTPPAKACGSPI